MALNLVASVVGLAGLHRLVARDLGVRVADRTILYLSIFPAALFLYAPFTEALFLAATAWAFVGAREGRWWLAAAAALVAGLTRTQGSSWSCRSPGRPRRPGGPAAWGATGRPRAWAPGRAPLGAPGLAAGTGRGRRRTARRPPRVRVVHVGRRRPPALRRAGRVGWTRVHPPWETVAAALDWIASGGQSAGIEPLNVAALVLFAVVTLLAVRRLPASYSLYAAASILLIAVRLQPIPLTSTTRLLLVVFPVFAALGIAGRHRRFDLAWTVVSALLLGFAAVTFVRGDFVG